MRDGKVTVCAIAALTRDDRVIGKNDKIPWDIPEDLKHFAQTTQGKPVIMGRRTWESFDDEYRPLPERPNIVITRSADYHAPGAAAVTHSPQSGLNKALNIASEDNTDEVYVIGGQSIYEALLPDTQKLVLTLIDVDIDGDTHFPAYKHKFEKTNVIASHPEHTPPYTQAVFKRQ